MACKRKYAIIIEISEYQLWRIINLGHRKPCYENPNYRWKDYKCAYVRNKKFCSSKDMACWKVNWQNHLGKKEEEKCWGQKCKCSGGGKCLVDLRNNKKSGWSRFRRIVVGVIKNEIRKFTMSQVKKANLGPFCKEFYSERGLRLYHLF